MIEVKEISFDDVPEDIIREGKKNRVTFENPEGAHWLAVFDEGEIVSVSCVVIPKKGKTARLKSSYTKEEHRNQGYFSKLVEYSLALCRTNRMKIATVFSTPFSLNCHMQHGALPVSRRNDITFMRYLIG